MLVMKFGGSSLADGRQIQKACEIVKSRRDRNPVVVCSAHKGVTDMLINAARAAAAGEPDASKITERQRGVLRELGADEWMLDPYLREIEDLLRGISLVREVSPRVLDHMQSFGERMSCRAVAFHFTRAGLKAEAYDAFELGFITDDRFGQARPLKGYEAGMKAAFASKVPAGVIPVVTGFIGKTERGEITTVGRNGSDYSATVIAAGVDAVECEIWTDTDGVMTADPNLVKEARNIPTMSFAEASELALYGGRVLHPSTLLPAVKKNIPVRVLNTNHPEHPGTVITERGGVETPVTSIAHKTGQAVLTIESAVMLGQPGFLARVFDVLGRLKVDVDMISTSEVTVSITCAPVANLAEVKEALEQHGRVTVAEKKSLLCIVGKDLKAQAGLGAKIFGALSQEQINVEMISHGAKAINLSLLVDDQDVRRAVPALHRALFG